VGDRINAGPLMMRQAMAAAAGVMTGILVAVPAGLPQIATAQLAFLSGLMAVVAVTDILTFRVPDVLVVATALSGIGFAFGAGDASAIVGAILRMALIGIAIMILREAYYRWRGFDGLGLGDVKLIASAGAWIDTAGIVHAVLLAALAALAVVAMIAAVRGWNGMTRLPFAAFLAPSITMTWLVAAL